MSEIVTDYCYTLVQLTSFYDANGFLLTAYRAVGIKLYEFLDVTRRIVIVLLALVLSNMINSLAGKTQTVSSLKKTHFFH